ncbi:hypothetical protein B0H14DRAFT_2583961 [Mycena olivaceomarginata]|nr:hypothetical protein B0H14DRAFT_2583961 [Mycena olivaceomarginata]
MAAPAHRSHAVGGYRRPARQVPYSVRQQLRCRALRSCLDLAACFNQNPWAASKPIQLTRYECTPGFTATLATKYLSTHSNGSPPGLIFRPNQACSDYSTLQNRQMHPLAPKIAGGLGFPSPSHQCDEDMESVARSKNLDRRRLKSRVRCKESRSQRKMCEGREVGERWAVWVEWRILPDEDTANITLEERGARALNWTGLPIEEHILGMSLEFPLESRSCISFRESSQGVQSQRGRG